MPGIMCLTRVTTVTLDCNKTRSDGMLVPVSSYGMILAHWYLMEDHFVPIDET
jgi:hypothetical protein